MADINNFAELPQCEVSSINNNNLNVLKEPVSSGLHSLGIDKVSKPTTKPPTSYYDDNSGGNQDTTNAD